ncbi:MAG: hypothetical protein FWG58_00550 [Methanomassiliicoccaceae archaeon]|nr:hypothetical protein [Methanomassiliicoccaceae archaeon]
MVPTKGEDAVHAKCNEKISEDAPSDGKHLVLMSPENRHHVEESIAENKELLRLLSE